MYLDVEVMPVDTVMVERRMVTIDTKRGPTRVEIERLVPLPDKDTLPVQTQKNLVEWGEKANASNLERGLLPLPVELTTEILDYFPTIGPYTAVYNDPAKTVLPENFLVRIDILRALSQVCIDYRRVFLPLLWESLNICFTTRKDNLDPAYRNVGKALLRKCNGLSANPNLASYIG